MLRLPEGVLGVGELRAGEHGADHLRRARAVHAQLGDLVGHVGPAGEHGRDELLQVLGHAGARLGRDRDQHLGALRALAPERAQVGHHPALRRQHGRVDALSRRRLQQVVGDEAVEHAGGVLSPQPEARAVAPDRQAGALAHRRIFARAVAEVPRHRGAGHLAEGGALGGEQVVQGVGHGRHLGNGGLTRRRGERGGTAVEVAVA